MEQCKRCGNQEVIMYGLCEFCLEAEDNEC
jgi:hypothetical protein